jgi:anti-sigma B factor antagonist
MTLDAEIDRHGADAAVVKLSGRMTLGTRLREVEAQIDALAREGVRKLILDLAKVDYLDSAGLGVLMILFGRMKAVNGQLRLVAPNARLADLFRLTCTDAIFTVDADTATALVA